MPIKRFFFTPITGAMILALFLVSMPEINVFDSIPVLVTEAEAGDKDKDKDKDVDLDDYTFDNADFSSTIDCSAITKLQILYHKDFITTPTAPGPNVLVTGSDGSQCVITIVKNPKTPNNANCGFEVLTQGGKLKINTVNKNNALNCEMCIDVITPRTIKIEG